MIIIVVAAVIIIIKCVLLKSMDNTLMRHTYMHACSHMHTNALVRLLLIAEKSKHRLFNEKQRLC